MRLSGRTPRANSRVNNHKLTETEEESLLNWILDLDLRGLAPRPETVREIADLLLKERGDNPPKTVGVNWVRNFVKRHPILQARFSRAYNYKRAVCEDPKTIRKWFNLVQNIIGKYGIVEDDIFNFDETGFAMGLTATAKVITRSEFSGRRSVLQPGNQEWVTSIEATSAGGWALPPCVIFKGKVFMHAWFEDEAIPNDWRFEVSDSGWTSDEIGVRWLREHFIPYTNSRKIGRYRLLVLDGHGSHLTGEFDRICKEHEVIPVCMPAHSSHLLQPLDVTCFSVLKRAYGKLIEAKTRIGVHHIDKLDFLPALKQARIEAFKTSNIKSSFAAAGLVPLDPERVISKLNIRIRTPTPPPSRGSVTSSKYSPKTPKTAREARR
jgi:hypothetical protein